MIQKKNILLTGAAGSVGIEACKELCNNTDKYNVRLFEIDTKANQKALKPYRKHAKIYWGDLRNISTLFECVNDADVIIHLAAVIPPLADKNTELAYQVNTKGTENLIKAAKLFAPDAFFLYASSISVYGDRVKTPFINVGDELKPSLGDYYAETKIMAEELIQDSGLKWSIFRLAAIFGPKTKMDPLFFHMPLNTSLEIATTRDTGYAFIKAIGKLDEINSSIFNLSGGETCRINYKTFIDRSFKINGLGKLDLPENAFAHINFHCGYYADASKLNDILHFQNDSIEDYFVIMKKHVSLLSKIITTVFSNKIKNYLLRKSDPYNALKAKNKELINRFFGQKMVEFS